VVYGLKHFRQYLIGRKLAIMEEFEFTVQHRAGSKHRNADALSPRPSTEAELTDGDESRSVRENGDVLVRTVCRPCVTSDLDYCPGHVTKPNKQVDEELARPKLWHVRSSSELAELQRQDPDIGPIAELRLQFEEQPSFDLIRERSVDTKVY